MGNRTAPYRRLWARYRRPGACRARTAPLRRFGATPTCHRRRRTDACAVA